MKNEDTGLKRLVSATRFSLTGLKATFKSEEAFRQEVIIAIVLFPIAVLISSTAVEFALLIATVLILMIVELLNTGIEVVVDRIGPEFHELSGKAKDAGSAAVFLAIFLLLLVWMTVIFF